FTDPRPEQLIARLAREGIRTFQQTARFVGASQLAVGDTMLTATRAIVVATGARPADLPIDGREHLVTSDRFMELPTLPSDVILVGGGYISFEFAHVAARAGARVTILHRGSRPLVEFDPGLVDLLTARTRALGIDVRLKTAARAIEPIGNGRYRVVADETGGAGALGPAPVGTGAGP